MPAVVVEAGHECMGDPRRTDLEILIASKPIWLAHPTLALLVPTVSVNTIGFMLDTVVFTAELELVTGCAEAKVHRER